MSFDRYSQGLEDVDGHPIRPRMNDDWTAADLMAHVFPPVRWAVPGLVAEGFGVFAGPPKVGKSWWMLNLGVAIAAGGKALGSIDVEQGEVLYLALEDTPRRLQDRLGKVLQDAPPPQSLTLRTDSPRLPDAADELRAWHDDHPDTRLVMIDVLAKIKQPADKSVDSYTADYLSTFELKQIADERGIAILCSHHTRKAESADWLDTISGTQGIAGSADSLLVLRRQRGQADAELFITGRDVEETTRALAFQPDLGLWTLLEGEASDYQLSQTRRTILTLLRDKGPLAPKQVATALGLKPDNAKQSLKRMLDDDQIDTDGEGHYFAPLEPVTPVTRVTQPVTAVTEVTALTA